MRKYISELCLKNDLQYLPKLDMIIYGDIVELFFFDDKLNKSEYKEIIENIAKIIKCVK